MPDLVTRADIDLLVRRFYERILVDELIGHFFTEVVALDLDEHLPHLCDFWETTLLGNPIFKGNPMQKHIALNQKSPMRPEHFDRWLGEWEATIRAHFQGPKSEEAIQRARQIGALMQFKVAQA